MWSVVVDPQKADIGGGGHDGGTTTFRVSSKTLIGYAIAGNLCGTYNLLLTILTLDDSPYAGMGCFIY